MNQHDLTNEETRKTGSAIEEISPELFIWELYDSSMLQSLEIWELAAYAIGYCDAGRLYVRPKPGEIALMCELPDGEKCWSHVDPKMLNGLNWRRETGRGIPSWVFDEDEEDEEGKVTKHD